MAQKTFQVSDIGANEFSEEAMAYEPYALVKKFTFANFVAATGGSVRVTVPAETVITGVGIVISGSFGTTLYGGGSDLMQVGIDSDLDAFIEPQLLGSGSVTGAYVQSMGASINTSGSWGSAQVALSKGKYCATPTNVVLTVTIKPAPDYGAGTLYVFCIGSKSNWRRAASGV